MPAKQSAKKVAKGPAGRKNENNSKTSGMSQIKEEDETKKADDVDEDLNSGFGNYLKSSQGNKLMYTRPLENGNCFLGRRRIIVYFQIHRC